MRQRLVAFYHRHEAFLLVFVLFLTFRLMAVWLMRPGGFVADASDYDFYSEWGSMGPRGYETFVNLWTAYPPLFPRLMLPIYELSSRIPPWVDPRLAFHSLFGAFLLLFECGNLILIYRLSTKLAVDEADVDAGEGADVPASAYAVGALSAPLHSVIFYALLFVPVHTMLGWFEAMPLFFLLLAMDLLLGASAWAWAGSAVAMGLGFLVKLTPIVLLPVAIRRLGASLSWEAARTQWFNPRSSGNLLRPVLYTVIAFATITGVGYLLVDGRTELAFSSLTVNSMRPPWQSIWALFDGYYGYGLVPVDMRNIEGLQESAWQSTLPWTWISVGFVAVYLYLYTRRYDWQRTRTVVAFTGVSAIWMFLYSKGWSPQFLVWVLAFVALLLPTARGVALAVTLSMVNIVEAYVYLILLPDERWILNGTVLLRTVLMIIVAVEFLAQIWPRSGRGRMQRWAPALTWIGVTTSLLLGVLSLPRMANAYGERRFAELPCRDAVVFLQQQSGGLTDAIATTEIDLWRGLYPWLRDEYTLRVIDGYDRTDRAADAVLSERLAAFAGSGEFWWLYSDAAAEPAPSSLTFFNDPNVVVLEGNQFGPCTLERVVSLAADGAQFEAAVDGGPIRLRDVEVGDARPGETLNLVLYWQAERAVEQSYTVFTQVLDPQGALVAQQDNLPVNGLAPTDSWEPDMVIRDPFLLELPAGLQAGEYRLVVGLYDGQGARARLQFADGSTADAWSAPLYLP